MNLASIASIFTQVVRVVFVAEQLFTQAKSGADKLAHVLPQVEGIIDGAPLSDEHKAALKAKAEHVVEQVVAFLNWLGALGEDLHVLTDLLPGSVSSSSTSSAAAPARLEAAAEPSLGEPGQVSQSSQSIAPADKSVGSGAPGGDVAA